MNLNSNVILLKILMELFFWTCLIDLKFFQEE